MNFRRGSPSLAAVKKAFPLVALLLGGCWVRHHPLEAFPASKKVPATLQEIGADPNGRVYSAHACTAKDGRRFVSFESQAGGLVYHWAYDASNGKLVWFDQHPWEGTPCPCFDLMVPSEDAWGKKPEMECGVTMQATPEALRELAPEAFAAP